MGRELLALYITHVVHDPTFLTTLTTFLLRVRALFIRPAANLEYDSIKVTGFHKRRP